jgi:hypothetical protein
MRVKVRLTRKFANILNGIDLSHVRAGEDVELEAREAQMLIAEGWANAPDRGADRPTRRRRSRKPKAELN